MRLCTENIKMKKALRKRSAFFWLGWRDSDPRDAGVKVLCLTAWRHPNMELVYSKNAHSITLWAYCFYMGWRVGFEPTVFRATI